MWHTLSISSTRVGEEIKRQHLWPSVSNYSVGTDDRDVLFPFCSVDSCQLQWTRKLKATLFLTQKAIVDNFTCIIHVVYVQVDLQFWILASWMQSTTTMIFKKKKNKTTYHNSMRMHFYSVHFGFFVFLFIHSSPSPSFSCMFVFSLHYITNYLTKNRFICFILFIWKQNHQLIRLIRVNK